MAKILEFVGKIAETSMDPSQSSTISSLMEESTMEELKTVCFECKEKIYDIAENARGSTFLVKLFAKLKEVEIPYTPSAYTVDPYLTEELFFIFKAFAVNPQKLKSTLISEIGCETFFSLLGESRYLKGEFVLLLEKYMFMEMMREPSNVGHFFSCLFQHLDLVQLEPLLVISSQNIIYLSHIDQGLKNMNVMITNANPTFAMSLVSKIKPFLLDIARDKKGNRFLQTVIALPNHSSDALVNGLAGNLFDMSQHLYANHILQRCLQLGSNRNASFIIFELTPHIFSLLTHPYGHYVVQRILKRLAVMNRKHFRDLSSQIITRRAEFENTAAGYEVLLTCQYCQRY